MRHPIGEHGLWRPWRLAIIASVAAILLSGAACVQAAEGDLHTQVRVLQKQVKLLRRAVAALEEQMMELTKENRSLRKRLAELRTVPTGAGREAAGKSLATVTVVGRGIDPDGAMRDAYRRAVEKGAGAYIGSRSGTKDFVLIRDTVVVRSEGFVEHREVLTGPKEEDDIWVVRIKAVVSVRKIANFWGATKTLLANVGRPRIMVFVDEKIDQESQQSSTVQAGIEEMLLESGFLLVDANQWKEISRRDLAAAVADDKPDRVSAIASRFGAQVFVSGTANATFGEGRRIAGVAVHTCGADANVRCYRSDTAQLVSSVPGRSTRGANRIKRSAARQALAGQAGHIAAKVRRDILRHWKGILEGRGEVVLDVSEIPEFLRYVELRESLQRIDGVGAISGKFAHNNARLSVQSGATAEVLATRIARALKGKLNVGAVSQNVIRAGYAAK